MTFYAKIEQTEEPVSSTYLVLFLLLTISAVGTEVYTLGTFITALQARNWPITQGVIVNSNLQVTFVGTHNTCEAEIEYSFTVDSQHYVSNRIRARGATSKYRSDIEPLIEKYVKGSAVEVFYNPDDPHNSFLEVGLDTIQFVIIILPLLFAIASGNAFIGGIRSRFD